MGDTVWICARFSKYLKCDANGQNCAPYQLYNVAEFFAVLSTAYHGLTNGSQPTGLPTASPL